MLDLLIVICCLTVNAFLAAYEMAFVTASREEIDELGQQSAKSERVGHFKKSPERTLSVIQIGITFVGAVAAAVGGTGAVENLEPHLIERFGLSTTMAQGISVLLIIIPYTYFSVVLGELVPKTIALQHPVKVLAFGTKAIFLIDKILSPIVTFLERSTEFFLTLFQVKRPVAEVPENIDLGTLPEYHRNFVHNLVGLRGRTVERSMLPWSRVCYLDYALTDDEAQERIKGTHHSRFPVIDRESLVGTLHVKEWNEKISGSIVPWQSILRPSLKVYQDEKVLEAFLKMQQNNQHLAVVANRNETFVGILCIEDVIEQIFGNIRDDLEARRGMKILANRHKMRL